MSNMSIYDKILERISKLYYAGQLTSETITSYTGIRPELLEHIKSNKVHVLKLLGKNGCVFQGNPLYDPVGEITKVINGETYQYPPCDLSTVTLTQSDHLVIIRNIAYLHYTGKKDALAKVLTNTQNITKELLTYTKSNRHSINDILGDIGYTFVTCTGYDALDEVECVIQGIKYVQPQIRDEY